MNRFDLRNLSSYAAALAVSVWSASMLFAATAVPADRCARQMRQAYETCLLGQIETRGGLAQAVRNHMDMLK